MASRPSVDFVSLARKSTRGAPKRGTTTAAAAAAAAADAAVAAAEAAAAAAPVAAGGAGGAGGAAAASASVSGSGSGSGTAVPEPVVVRRVLSFSFGYVASQFLNAAAAVWPQCPVIKDWHARFEQHVAVAADDAASTRRRERFYTTLIEGFHDAFQKHYKAIAAQDAAAMLREGGGTAWLTAVHAKAKWERASAEVRTRTWEFTNLLARFANLYALYSVFPASILERVHGLASELGLQLQAGTLSFKELGPASLARHLTRVLKQSELQKLAADLNASSTRMEAAITLLQSMLALSGGGGNFMANMEQLLAAATAASEAEHMPPA